MNQDMRSISEIREANMKKALKGVTIDAKNVQPAQYCVDISSGLVMTRAEYIAYDRA